MLQKVICALAVGLLVATLVGFAPNVSMGAPASRPHQFRVGNLVLTGHPMVVCVVEGRWYDRRHLRYQAWDRCEKLTVGPASAADLYRARRTLRRKGKLSGALPLVGAIVIENDFSRALLYLDKAGVTQDVLIGD